MRATSSLFLGLCGYKNLKFLGWKWLARLQLKAVYYILSSFEPFCLHRFWSLIRQWQILLELLQPAVLPKNPISPCVISLHKLVKCFSLLTVMFFFFTLLFMSTCPRRCSVHKMLCLLSLSVVIEGIMGWWKSLPSEAEFSSSVKHFMDLNCHQNPDCDHFHVVHPLPRQIHYHFCWIN